jgi:hypothetical protein
MKAAVAFSGGLDSTYAIWKILTTTQDSVTAVIFDLDGLLPEDYETYDIRIFLRNAKLESSLAKVQPILDWFAANLRPVNLAVVPITPDKLIHEHPNTPETYFTDWGVGLVNAGDLDRIIITHEKENDGNANRGRFGKEGPGSWLAYDRFMLNATRGSLEFPLLDSDYHHGVAMAEIPHDLMALVSSCNSGRENCTCFKCSKMKFFERELQAGKTTSEISNYIMSKSLQPNGRWLTMKTWLGEEDIGYIPSMIFEEKDMPTWPSSVFKS